jgi:polyhydroxyalkanoate synthase
MALDGETLPIPVPGPGRSVPLPPPPPKAAGDEPPPPNGFHTLDRIFRAAEARVTQGVAPTAVAGAWADWLIHLGRAPGKQMSLAHQVAVDQARYWLWLARGGALRPGEVPPLRIPVEGDPRFADPGWKEWPFSAIAQQWKLAESWWLDSTRAVPGLSRRHA